tara:strand:+ start:205 stop:588 length:384 start_codon:yes stop_codon:yes gene_type:complete
MASTQTVQVVDFQPTRLNLCVTRGDSPFIPVSVTSGGSPLDLAGGTFLLTVSTEEDPADNTNQVFQVTGVVVGDSTNGNLTFQPTETDNDLNPNTEYFYDISAELASIGKRTLFKGKYEIAQDIGKD